MSPNWALVKVQSRASNSILIDNLAPRGRLPACATDRRRFILCLRPHGLVRFLVPAMPGSRFSKGDRHGAPARPLTQMLRRSPRVLALISLYPWKNWKRGSFYVSHATTRLFYYGLNKSRDHCHSDTTGRSTTERGRQCTGRRIHTGNWLSSDGATVEISTKSATSSDGPGSGHEFIVVGSEIDSRHLC